MVPRPRIFYGWVQVGLGFISMGVGHALFFALGYGVFAPLIPAIAGDIFQGKQFGSIYGLLYSSIGLGAAIGPFLAGYIHDVTGSYRMAFLVAIGAITISCISYWFAAPRKFRLAGGKMQRLGTASLGANHDPENSAT